MATLKQRLNRKNSSGTYDTVHLETSSEVVKRPSGTTVESDLTNYLPKVQNSDSVPESLSSGQLVTGQTSLIYKGNDGTARIINPASYQPVGSYATTAQLNEVKTSVSNGKSLIASAITDKGVSTASSATFQTMASNIRSIGMIVPATLPAGYTACNYIQTDGNAWINTGIDLTSSAQYLNEIFISSIFPSDTVNNNGALLSAINSDNQSSIYITQTCQINYGVTNYFSTIRCGNQAGSGGTGASYYHFANTDRIDYYIGLSRSVINEGKPCRWGVNNAYVFSNSESGYSVYKAVIYLWKYGYNQASGTNGSAAPGSKIYEFLYYYNHELKSHMLPCINSSGTVGLYDVVRNAFYGNNGTGSLTYG